MYFVGFKRITICICVIFISLGFIINYFLHLKYQINPSIFNLIDYQIYDFVCNKPWNYIHPYFAGVLLSFVYYEFTKIKKFGTKDKNSLIVYIYEWAFNSYHSPSILFTISCLCMYLFFYVHTFASRDSQYNE